MRTWLRELRIQQNMSQAHVASQSNISVQFYSYIENGERRPSPDVAKRIAAVLGFSDEWYRLLDEVGETTKEVI